MISFPSLHCKPPSHQQHPLKRYSINFSFSRLLFGIDSIHIDVHVSPQLHTAVKKAVSLLMIKHSRAEKFFLEKKKDHRENEKLELKRICTEVLSEGINRAKAESEVQIDFLGQLSLAKMFLEETQNEYQALIARFEILIRNISLSRQYDQYEWLKMRDKLAEIKRDQNLIIRLVGEELFGLMADINTNTLKNLRETNFPAECILPDNFFINPTFHIDNVADDFFLMDAYVLMGQRSDEPDNYNNLKAIIIDLFSKTDLLPEGTESGEAGNRETNRGDLLCADGNALDPWLKEIGNVDPMFNCFATKTQYIKAKRRKISKEVLLELEAKMKDQEQLLNRFYKEFKRQGLLKLIVAAYEMKTIYRSYCPPLRPVQIREYLVKRGARKSLVRELKRRKSSGGKDVCLAPLQETIRRIRFSFAPKKKVLLLGFLKDFLRYHRDLENGWLVKQAIGAINLIQDEKNLILSKKNRLLYEFPLLEKGPDDERPVIGHVILKADIRGSMDIAHTMSTRGLNVASYFSLNFFDPISEIVYDYNATKEFIEGDAIILSMFENEDRSQGGYSVARACGLAINMLNVVRQYNIKNQKHDLPILELGIGICYKQSPPAYLFDGDSKIMISQAINLADRLSSCDKKLRKRFKDQERMFNLFVFQHVRNEDIEATADDLSLRYNVNGIELHPEGFAKLTGEISLKSIEYPLENEEKVTLYTGKVPTISGKYQRLVIREAAILEVKPETMDVIGPTARKYYEVCTQPAIYEFIDKHASHAKSI